MHAHVLYKNVNIVIVAHIILSHTSGRGIFCHPIELRVGLHELKEVVLHMDPGQLAGVGMHTQLLGNMETKMSYLFISADL